MEPIIAVIMCSCCSSHNNRPNVILDVILITGYFACGQRWGEQERACRITQEAEWARPAHTPWIWINPTAPHIIGKVKGNAVYLCAHGERETDWETLSSSDTNVEGTTEVLARFPMRYCNKHSFNEYSFPLNIRQVLCTGNIIVKHDR